MWLTYIIWSSCCTCFTKIMARKVTGCTLIIMYLHRGTYRGIDDKNALLTRPPSSAAPLRAEVIMDRSIFILRCLYTSGLWNSSTSKALASSLSLRALHRICAHNRRQIHSCVPLLASKMNDKKFRATLDTINPLLIKMRYAVRGSLPKEAKRIESAIRKVSGWIYTMYKLLYLWG